MSFSSFPEELVERILADAVVAVPAPSTRPSWHRSSECRTRVAPVLVSKQFHRISLGLLYSTVVLHTPTQSASFLAALRAQPQLARCVRRLVLLAPCDADVEIARLLRVSGAQIAYLDVTLPHDDHDSGLAHALRGLGGGLRHLVIRKPPATYLSQCGPRAVLDALSTSCTNLESATLSFPLSPDPALASLVAALTAAPALHTLRAPAPSFWTPTLLGVAQNPALRRICLNADLAAAPSFTSRRPLIATSLFLSVARTHGRLSDLIRAGTSVLGWRVRAWTMGSVDASASAGSYPGASAAPDCPC
ncbi:hypothetical protein MKEN_00505000 [Mycena kentingensis (nom. inval.)]|nr:hypothetical protein MKEN_00505000 [Mycena kentingensis (nom. inval.)]